MRDLTVGKESKLIFWFALPMLLGNLLQQTYHVVDSMIVGKYIGDDALAAVGESFPVIFVLIALIIGISSGVTIVISQYFGAKDLENVKRAIDTMFVFIFFSSIFITIIGLAFSRHIFELLELPDEVIPMATAYLNIFILGLILLFGFNGTNAILRGLGDSKTPLYFLIISTILNIILDLIFVIVLKWGIEGVAIATVISQGFAFICAIIYLNKTHSIIKFTIRKPVFDKKIFYKSLKIGIPTGMQQAFVALGMMALFRIVNDFGTVTIAAYSVAMRLDSFAALPAMNFSSALSTFVGQNIGANKIERVKKGFRATFFMTAAISLTVTLIAIFFGENIMRAFTNSESVIQIGKSYLIIVCSFYIFFSTMFVINGVLRGAGATLIPMFITLIALWVLRVPLSYILSRESVGLGSDGIWWGIPIAWFFGCVCSYIYYLTGKWKTKSVVKYNETNS